MDTATKSLNHILKSGEYSVIKNVPVFDEHDEYDAEGKLVRRFDKKALQKIVDECNRRADSTGDLSPVGPGHTIHDAPEHKQPPTYAYAKNYRVGTFGPDKKTGILADWYVKKTVTTPDGKAADGVAEVKSYPRRSIELWLKDGFIDHIALLRRTPQRDLGLLECHRRGDQIQYAAIPSINNIFRSSKQSLAAAVRGGKLCYAMEPDMPMDSVPAMGPATGPPGASSSSIPGMDGGDDEYQKFCSMADRYMKENFGDNLAQYMVQEGPPAGDSDVPTDPTIPPSADTGDDDLQKMARQYAKADQRTQVAMFQRLASQVAALKTDSQAQTRKYSEDDASSRVAYLASIGVVMDPAKMKLKFAKLPLGQERDELQQEAEQFYQRDHFAVAQPVRGAMLDVGNGRTNGKGKKYSRADVDKAVDIASRTGRDYNEILADMAK